MSSSISSICSLKNDSIEHVGEDVLQMIFKLLEVEDLENCEAVCRQWRAILQAGTPWRRLFNRRVFSPLLRQALKKLDIDCKLENLIGSKQPQRGEELSLKMKPSQYRDVCKNVLEVKRNWRTAKFTKWTHAPPENSSACNIEITDDCVSWNVEIQEKRRTP
jgi:F-box-like